MIASKLSHFIPKRKGVAPFRIEDSDTGIKGIFRGSADSEVKGKHEMERICPSRHKWGTGTGKFFVNGFVVRFKSTRCTAKVLSGFRFFAQAILGLVVRGRSFLRQVQKKYSGMSDSTINRCLSKVGARAPSWPRCKCLTRLRFS